ncbi:MAG: stage II sporulation protein M [Clostridiales bacterium]|nr:stage II sporulation protein M [Candidatus Cacconaster stercorequi]
MLLICVCCAVGILLGGLANHIVTAPGRAALEDYLRQYAQNAVQSSVSGASLLSVAITYLRYPVLLFFLGMMAAGVFLIPLICMTQSFFLSFAVCGFASALGRTGVALAFAAFGLRCVITMPCILAMSIWAMDASDALRRNGLRKMRRNTSLYAMRFGVCVVFLLLGAVSDCAVVPRLIASVLHRLT